MFCLFHRLSQEDRETQKICLFMSVFVVVSVSNAIVFFFNALGHFYQRVLFNLVFILMFRPCVIYCNIKNKIRRKKKYGKIWNWSAQTSFSVSVRSSHLILWSMKTCGIVVITKMCCLSKSSVAIAWRFVWRAICSLRSRQRGIADFNCNKWMKQANALQPCTVFVLCNESLRIKMSLNDYIIQCKTMTKSWDHRKTCILWAFNSRRTSGLKKSSKKAVIVRPSFHLNCHLHLINLFRNRSNHNN